MIYNSFKVEAKYMKTSHSRAWECKPFTHEFMIFKFTALMDIRVHINTSYNQSWESNILSKVQ